MALVIPQAATIIGAALVYATPTTSETIVPMNGAVYHIIIGATSTTVTVIVPGSQYGQARPDVVVASAATNTTRQIGGLVTDLADPTTGLITITFSQTTNVTAALIYT